MLPRPPVRPRRVRSMLTPTRITTALAFALVLLSVVLPGAGSGLVIGAYLVLVLATAVVIRGVRQEPGVWLGRRAVRRCLVVLLAFVCVALVASPAPTAPAGSSGIFELFLLLIVLNIALGRATQRVATAPDTTVDERQEVQRNRAHRIAYAIFAVGVAGTALVADIASPQTRSWLGSSLGGGGLIAFLELLFVLPAMVLAFLDRGRIPQDSADGVPGSKSSARARVGAALLALMLAMPLVLSLGVLIVPVHVTSYPSDPTGAPLSPTSSNGTVAHCREFFAVSTVGLVVTAELFLQAEACWDGHKAYETYGMNATDCLPRSAALAVVTTALCERTTRPNGTLSFTYRSQVSSVLLPFLHRDVTLQLVIDRNGRVEAFP